MTSHLRANTFAAAILLAVVSLSPLPLGSTVPLFIAVECGLLGFAAITLTLRKAENAHLLLLLCLAVVPTAYLFVLHEQISQHPWVTTGFPSVWWGRASAALAEPLTGSRSLIRDQPWFSVGAPLAAGLALMIGLIVGTDRVWARRLIDWVFYVGTAYAAFAIASFVSDPTHIFTFEKFAYRDVLTGTFINRNTAAVYFGNCVVLGTVNVAVALSERNSSDRRLRSPFRLLPDVPQAALLPAAFCLINLVAVLMTASRAGTVLSILASMAVAGLVFRSRLNSIRAMLTALAVTAIGVGMFLTAIAGNVFNRFALQGADDGGRLEIYQATWGMVKEYWRFGAGLGTFRWSFSPYRPDGVPIWGIWDRAHNVVLEIAAEAGLPLALLVLGAAIAIVGLLARGTIARRRDRDIPIAALGVALLAFTHAFVDFSLQIPGYAITAFALIGAGLAQSFSTVRGTPGAPS